MSQGIIIFLRWTDEYYISFIIIIRLKFDDIL